MTFRINFIGAPGSGKTFIAQQLMLAIKAENQHSVEFLPETARHQQFQLGPMRSVWEQLRTCQKQREYELTVPPNVNVAITDSGVTAGYFYACDFIRNNPFQNRDLVVVSDLYSQLIEDIYRPFYDLTFFAGPPEMSSIANDPGRIHNVAASQVLNDHMYNVFCVAHRHAKCLTLPSKPSERLPFVLDHFKKEIISSPSR